jgi:carbamate kinase
MLVAEKTGKKAAIGSLVDLEQIVPGEKGTHLLRVR